MSVGQLLFSFALGLVLACATPLKGSPRSLSLPLHRHFSPYESEDAQGQLPLKVNGIESLVYTVDVQVGSQRFNLTLDTNAQGSVLFAKGFVASNRSCSKGDAQRNLFDPSLSKSFRATTFGLTGWPLSEYPYVGLECHQTLGTGETYDGVWAHDTYQFGDVSVPDMSFVLANHTYYPLNPRWASDGVLALDTDSGVGRDDLQKLFDAFGGAHEVSLFLNNERPSDNQPVPGGRITFGGKNTQDCSDNWVTLQSDTYDWSLMLNSVVVGSHSINAGDFAELSTSTPFLQVPPQHFRPVINELGGKFNDELDLFTVDCSNADSLSPISFVMSSGFGLVYTVKAQDYVAKIDGKNGVQCALLIVQSDDGWVVGTQFLPNRCMHLDYAKSQISFADPKN